MSKFVERAKDYVKRRNYDGAIELFQQELKLNPDNDEARKQLRAIEVRKWSELGQPMSGAGKILANIGSVVAIVFYRLTGKHEKAMIECEKILTKAPKSKAVLGWLAKSAQAAGHSGAAISVFEDIANLDPKDADAARELGRLHNEAGNLQDSLKWWERVKRANPQDGEAAKAIRDLAAKGSTMKMESKQEGGEGSYRDLIRDSKRARRLEKGAHMIRSKEDVQEAIELLEEQVRENPGDPKLHKKMGDVYLKGKMLREARESYEQALSLRPDDPILKSSIGDVRIKEFDSILSKIKRKLRKEKGNQELLAKYKAAEQKKNEYCIEEYTRRVEDQPTELSLRFRLGQYLFKAKQYDEAIAHFQKATRDPRRKAKAHNFLGLCFGEKGMHDLAIKELEKARAETAGMDEVRKEVTYNIACLLEKAGRIDEAKEEFERIIEVDIAYRDASEKLQALTAR